MKTAFSAAKDPDTAVEELKGRLAASNPSAVVFFASPVYEPGRISGCMKKAFPDAALMGCTTAGEFVAGHSLENSIVAAALGRDEIEDVALACVENITENCDLSGAFAGFEKHFGQPLSSLDIDRYVGLVLVDGLSFAEEKIMEKIGAATDVFFIGGSAADNGAFRETFLYANGKTLKNGCLLALMKVKNGFSVVKTQSVEILDKTFTVTKADSRTRTICELDGRPAAEAYCEAAGLPFETLRDGYKSHPFGLVVDNDPYVRSIRAIDGSTISLYCHVETGSRLHLLRSKSDEIVKSTKESFESTVRKMGGASGAIVFNCILRKLELDSAGSLDAFAGIFSVPAVGFHTYGEEYLGHLNQTTTAILLK